MPGEGHRFTAKGERMHEHIMRSLEAEGFTPDEARSKAWATVTKDASEGAAGVENKPAEGVGKG